MYYHSNNCDYSQYDHATLHKMTEMTHQVDISLNNLKNKVKLVQKLTENGHLKDFSLKINFFCKKCNPRCCQIVKKKVFD